MKKFISLFLLAALLMTLAACRRSDSTIPGESQKPTPATEEQTQPEATEVASEPAQETEADFSSWDYVVELINLRGDTTTAYLLADGTYMDRVDRVFIYDGGERWMCGDEEWNRQLEGTVQAEDEPAFTLERAIERLLAQRPDAVLFEDSTGEFAEKYAFWAKEPVSNFVYQEIAVDVMENGELLCKEKKELFTAESVGPDDVLVISLQVEGAIPNRGIEYTDAAGITHSYYITMSGFDGSMLLLPLYQGSCGAE